MKKKKKLTCKNVIPPSDTNITAVIDSNALKNNIQYLKHMSKTDLMPVIKANAYGHGIIEIAKKLRQLHIKYIGVATAGEAILLRNNGDNGRISAPICIGLQRRIQGIVEYIADNGDMFISNGSDCRTGCCFQQCFRNGISVFIPIFRVSRRTQC